MIYVRIQNENLKSNRLETQDEKKSKYVNRQFMDKENLMAKHCKQRHSASLVMK